MYLFEFFCISVYIHAVRQVCMCAFVVHISIFFNCMCSKQESLYYLISIFFVKRINCAQLHNHYRSFCKQVIRVKKLVGLPPAWILHCATNSCFEWCLPRYFVIQSSPWYAVLFCSSSAAHLS